MQHKIKRFLSASAVKDWLEYSNFDRHDDGPKMSEATLYLISEFEHYIKVLEIELDYMKREKEKSQNG